MTLSTSDLAYAAALIDNFGKLKTRRVGERELPEVIIQGKIRTLPWLAYITGVKLIEVSKGYHRHQCSQHCPTAHTEIVSVSNRWVLTGARATIVLHNVEPFMRAHGREARALVEVGQAVGYRGGVVNSMTTLGWKIPDLREQPRARVQLIR